jgi:hypothetical protein
MLAVIPMYIFTGPLFVKVGFYHAVFSEMLYLTLSMTEKVTMVTMGLYLQNSSNFPSHFLGRGVSYHMNDLGIFILTF